MSPPRLRLSLDCCLLSILPFGPSPLFFTGAPISTTFYPCLPRFLSGSLPFRSAPDWNWVLTSLHTNSSLSTSFLRCFVHFAPSGKLWAPCHLGQPPLFSILYFPPAAKGSLPFRSVPLVASSIFPCLSLFFSTLVLGFLPFRSVPTARRLVPFLPPWNSTLMLPTPGQLTLKAGIRYPIPR